MNEIQIFYDREKTRKVVNPISFEPVKTGETTKKSLFFSNEIEFPLNLTINLIGESVNIVKNIINLLPEETKEVIFEFSPSLITLKPIKAELIVNIDYIVK